jgi:saccharopine dehydrogenase-like NADP-dependent oxidoreductase
MTIGVVGAGKIGATIATLLESCAFCGAVAVADVRSGVKIGGLGKTSVTRLDAHRRTALAAFVKRCDAIVSAVPYFLNREIVEACAQARVAYFDLTEDVATTTLVRTLADRAKDVTFVPQCGLAPGAINIVGGALAASLDSVRSVEMRVGALPLTASNQMKYYLSWSTAGLINEYCQLGEALHAGQRIATLPLDGVERLTIDGVEYEAFNTAGGVATMCETFEGKVGELVQRSFVKKIRGGTVEGRQLSAIQLSTAAGVVALLELYARGAVAKSFVRQESITFDQFLSTQWGERVYGGEPLSR